MYKENKKIASDNNSLSNNDVKVKNSLCSFEGIFKGLEKTVAIFFPSMRSAMVDRYKAQTIAMVGVEAVRLAQQNNIELKPIPPKMAMPLIEEMSLEHESEMYEMWARLLVSSANNFNPIQQQYINVLSNINGEQAKLLEKVYNKQKTLQNPEQTESIYEESLDAKRYKKHYEDIKRRSNLTSFIRGGGSFRVSDTFDFPYLIEGKEKVQRKYGSVTINGKRTKEESYEQMEFSEEQKNLLLGLKKLGLIQYDYTDWGSLQVGENQHIEVMRYGILLTNFGYSFIKCLENLK